MSVDGPEYRGMKITTSNLPLNLPAMLKDLMTDMKGNQQSFAASPTSACSRDSSRVSTECFTAAARQPVGSSTGETAQELQSALVGSFPDQHRVFLACDWLLVASIERVRTHPLTPTTCFSRSTGDPKFGACA